MGFAQTLTTAINSEKNDIEYAIYTFRHDENLPAGSAAWAKHDSMRDMRSAIDKAQALYDTGGYCKVEIKRRTISACDGCASDMTLRSFEHKDKTPLPRTISATLIGIFGVLAFLVAYYFGQ